MPGGVDQPSFHQSVNHPALEGAPPSRSGAPPSSFEEGKKAESPAEERISVSS